jgi:hypothetical protein
MDSFSSEVHFCTPDDALSSAKSINFFIQNIILVCETT